MTLPKHKTGILLRDIHDHITCFLCDGYFVDATTIIECLHSFCKSCLVRYLSLHKSCPICNVQVHKTKPLLNIRSDQTLQDIVYKLVPGLRENEMHRRKNYFDQNSDAKASMSWRDYTLEELGDVDSYVTEKPIKKLSISIEPYKKRRSNECGKDWVEIKSVLPKRYMRCSEEITMLQLHKLITKKLQEVDDIEVLLFHEDQILPQNYSFVDIIESQPSIMGQGVVELSYIAFAPSRQKRAREIKWKPKNIFPLEDTVSPAKKEIKNIRPKSATPQLKAFFNSQLTPKINTKNKITKPAKKTFKIKPFVDFDNLDESTNVEKRDLKTKIQLLEMVQLQTVDRPKLGKNEAEQTDKKVRHKITNQATAKSCKPVPRVKTKEKSIEVCYSDQNLCNPSNNNPSKSLHKMDVSASKPYLSSNKTKNVVCYTMLNIPVSEAVLSEPPTPVEVPVVSTYATSKQKRDTTFNSSATFILPKPTNMNPKSYVQQQQRSRRKPTNPQHSVKKSNLNEKPNVVIQPVVSTVVQSDLVKQSLNPVVQPNEGYKTIRISNESTQTGQFILLTTPQAQSQMQNNRGYTNLAPKPVSSKPTLFVPATTGTANNKSLKSGQYQSLSNAQAHKVALEAVRNSMGGYLHKEQQRHTSVTKRPILPKVGATAPIQPVVMKVNGIPHNSQRVAATPTRNIFQNTHVSYPMSSTASSSGNKRVNQQSSPLPKLPATQDNHDHIKSLKDMEDLKNLRTQHNLLMAKAAAKSQKPKEKFTSTFKAVPDSIARALKNDSVQGKLSSSKDSERKFIRKVLHSSLSPKPFVQRPSKLHNPSQFSDVFNKEEISGNLRGEVTFRSPARHVQDREKNRLSYDDNPRNRTETFTVASKNFTSKSSGAGVDHVEKKYFQNQTSNHRKRSFQFSNDYHNTPQIVNTMQDSMRKNQQQKSLFKNSSVQKQRQQPNILRRSGEKKGLLSPQRPITSFSKKSPYALSAKSSKPSSSSSRSRSVSYSGHITTPPPGTKSPWSSRNYNLPDDLVESAPALKKRKQSPPPAHQASRLNLNFQQSKNQSPSTSFSLLDNKPNELAPLDFTSKKRNTNLSEQERNDDSQPLCLVVKKRT